MWIGVLGVGVRREPGRERRDGRLAVTVVGVVSHVSWTGDAVSGLWRAVRGVERV